jgi:FkbM family methyltransferase
MKLYKTQLLRNIFLPIFRVLNPGDITIRHPLTKLPIRLHSFKHKGYWFHGSNREKSTMRLFSELIHAGDTVFEIGGHIGFITQYFSTLVGTSGRVVVFEPGENNLPYLKANTSKLTNVSIIENAVSDIEGTVRFYLEDLTGQNNSILADYSKFLENEKAANTKAKKVTREVHSTRIDSFRSSSGTTPTFIKIDIEGAELSALQGMPELLSSDPPMLMVEITENHISVTELLSDYGYNLYAPRSRVQLAPNEISGNTFCLHSLKHKQQISDCFR